MHTENYGDEWQEAISMFDQGVVNARHLQKLFQPNQLVIFKNTDNFNVYALEGAPLISKEHIIFTGWSYFYDKVDLRLKPWYTTRPNSNVWPMNLKWEDEITPDMILLLPSTVYGFNLQEKKWGMAALDIGNTQNVAEIAEKPLYRVTCGDIGTEAQDVEKYLATVLYLGKLWDCVLLLDEADVFLEERTFADLQRNSLVSVFLRVLEYYEGILILTSNRVGHFDEAFKSRIQVAIHYDNLSKKSRKAIWQNFLDMIQESEDEDANIAELEEHLDQLASEEMNGRQIRNALLTARQLAKHRKERLEWEHLDQVMKTSAAFNKYLKTVRGQSDDKLARDEGRR
ncbi:hypothetical protein N0V92_006278 [Colletotrichum tropicale]|nr:hypothetical protein N0V92_006278 [Colletotrichum tropicale]